MNFRLSSLFSSVLLAGVLAVGARADDRADRLAVSFLLGLGRAPAAAESAEWAKGDAATLPDLLARHRQRLQADKGAAEAVARRSGIDAFGRAPTPAEIAAWSAAGKTYAELLTDLLRTLAADPAEYQRLLDRAYQLHLARPPYSVEIEYWQDRPRLSFVLLVGCIENWARRNAPGLTATSGTPAISLGCPYLATIRLSPAVAAEARAAIGLAPAGGAEFAAALGRHLVAPGAAEIATVGRMHFAAVGSEALLAPGTP